MRAGTVNSAPVLAAACGAAQFDHGSLHCRCHATPVPCDAGIGVVVTIDWPDLRRLLHESGAATGEHTGMTLQLGGDMSYGTVSVDDSLKQHQTTMNSQLALAWDVRTSWSVETSDISTKPGGPHRLQDQMGIRAGSLTGKASSLTVERHRVFGGTIRG